MVLSVVGTASYSFSNDITINIELDGENVTVSSLAFPFGKDIRSMENEIADYSLKEMNNVNSDVSSLRNGIFKIAERYGYTNINIEIKSQFGKNKLPMVLVVEGWSMYPTVDDGEEIIIEKTNNFNVGDIVIARDLEYGLLIKRVGNISGDRVFLSSDNNDTVTILENGTTLNMVPVEKWTDASNIVGVVRIFNINSI